MKLVKVCAPVAAAAVLAVGGFMFSNQTRDAFAGAPTAANASVEQAAAHTEPSLPSPENGTIPGFDELIGSLVVVDELPEISGYERDCGKGKAPLTELNAERCWSEGVGSMWVGSLRT